jgi:hypothetical protein
MNTTPKLPKIGSLVKLRPYGKGMDYVKVESINDGQEVRDFPPGTIAMVIEHAAHPDDKGRDVALLLVDGFTGWVFDDEWTYVAIRRQKRAS